MKRFYQQYSILTKIIVLTQVKCNTWKTNCVYILVQVFKQFVTDKRNKVEIYINRISVINYNRALMHL